MLQLQLMLKPDNKNRYWLCLLFW